ncbi:MAG: iron ABC transporter permease [Deltaproteobacteria bacterium]|nr:iron ABC transporter permease [Deltaproteobacteria bacterium]
MTEKTVKQEKFSACSSGRFRRWLPKTPLARPWILGLILLIAIIGSLFMGAYPIPWHRILEILLNSVWPFSGSESAYLDLREITVVTLIRPPRILVAVLAGIALGMSGTALQGMMRNPLVGPDLVGVTSGAAFGAVLAMWLGFLYTPVILVLSTIGGIAAMLGTMALARVVGGRNDSLPLILAGFFIGAFFLAGVGLLIYLENPFYPKGQRTGNIIYWLLGTFRGAGPVKAWTIAVPTIVGGTVLMGLRWRLNLLSLGDLDASSLGINLNRLRWILITVVSLMVAGQVAVSGVVGWVGLIIPHAARMLVGPDHRRLIPASAMLGGLFVLGLDNFTRTVIWSEVPVGVLSAIFGTPLICFLFWKTKTKGWNE